MTDWIKIEDGLPQAVDKKMKPVLAATAKTIKKCYYFPEHFKSVEWEDWDDYSEVDFPYTENDAEKEIVWLRPGWYEEIDCDRCEGYWSSPLPVTHWQPLPDNPNKKP